MYSSKIIVAANFLFFAVLAVAIIGQSFAPKLPSAQKINIVVVAAAVASPTSSPAPVGHVPTPEAEYQLFYELVKEKIEETMRPAEVLRFINDLKAVSVHIYAKYYAPSSPEMTALRAAAYQGTKKALEEVGLKIWPNI